MQYVKTELNYDDDFCIWVDILTEYNLEFQGSVQNLQKRALFMKFDPECLEITMKCIKITLLLAKRALFVIYYKGQHLTTGR